MGYGVLPMALEQDVIIACALKKSESKTVLSVYNTENNLFSSKKYDELKIVESKEWTNYILCGVLVYFFFFINKGALEFGKIKFEEIKSEICLLVDGNVPIGSGLSSSSALTW
jgi:galactokinase